jgi:hypothetical protein
LYHFLALSAVLARYDLQGVILTYRHADAAAIAKVFVDRCDCGFCFIFVL